MNVNLLLNEWRAKMSKKEELELRLKYVILSTCNTVGCKDCPLKWPEDDDGNKCQSDYLMMRIANAK